MNRTLCVHLGVRRGSPSPGIALDMLFVGLVLAAVLGGPLDACAPIETAGRAGVSGSAEFEKFTVFDSILPLRPGDVLRGHFGGCRNVNDVAPTRLSRRPPPSKP